MKAVRCNAWGLPETLVVEDIPAPVPKAGEVLLDINAASVNFPDVLMIQPGPCTHRPSSHGSWVYLKSITARSRLG